MRTLHLGRAALLGVVGLVACTGEIGVDDSGHASDDADAAPAGDAADAGPRDANGGFDPFDAGPLDAGPNDAAPLDGPAPPADAYVPPTGDYLLLSQTGLYVDVSQKQLSPDVIEYAPEYELWSDGAKKRRWIWLPPGTQIDTANMDVWRFPIGTKVWKEFAHVGPNGTLRLETRLVERRGPNPNDVWVGSFAWYADESDAAFSKFGVTNARGTDHDIPAADHCGKCHRGEPSRILGFSAIQLSHPGPRNLQELAALGLFTHPPAPGVTYEVPGDPVAAAALGYLHANCGHCHNPEAGLACHAATGLSLRLYTTDATVEATDTYTTAVGKPLMYWVNQGYTYRVVPGDVGASALYYRMAVRGEDLQMPPAFTEVADPAGLSALAAWIDSLE